MKTTKLFMMVALAVMTAACNKEDIDPDQQPAGGEITITAKFDAQDGAMTRVLGIDGVNISSTWEDTDEFAILFNDGTSDVKRIATVDEIDGTTAVITFTIPEALANNTACTIVYPASAANAANTGADVATALAAQDGSIGNCPEVRIGTAVIDKDDRNLSSVTALAAQNAIFKFTLGSAIDATHPLIIKDGSDNTIVTVTPTASTTEAYVAMPAGASATYKFQANTADNKIAKSGAATIVAGKYYQTTLAASYPKLLADVSAEDLGSVVTSDGYICLNAAGATAFRKTAVAMIAYFSGSDCKHGLAIELKCDFRYTTDLLYGQAKTYAANRSSVYGISPWHMPTKSEWQNMFLACRKEGDANSASNVMGPIEGFVEKMTATGISWYSDYDTMYWTSTNAWTVSIEPNNYAYFDVAESTDYGGPAVRACLAF